MANFNFNKVILGGRLCAEPEYKTTPSGKSVTSFTLAVTRRGGSDGKNPVTDFISCVAWDKSAEFITKYFRRGSALCIVGEVRVRRWETDSGEKRSTVEILVHEATFVDSKGDVPSGQAGAVSVSGASSLAEVGDDEDIPF